jgi:hypothetical protein
MKMTCPAKHIPGTVYTRELTYPELCMPGKVHARKSTYLKTVQLPDLATILILKLEKGS